MNNQISYKGELLAEDSALLKGGILYEAKELRADALEANSLQITVVSESGTIMGFDLNDKIEFFRAGRRRGIYYLQSVTRVGPRSYELYALSAVGRLMTMRHAGGIYTGETVAEVAREICGDLPVLIETAYASRQVYGWLPYAAGGDGRSARDNLADLLFSVGAWLGTDENGVLRVEKLWDGTASTIPAGRVDARNNAEKTAAAVSAIAVTEHQFVPSSETVQLLSGTAEQGKLVIFDEPMHDLSATGFSILESGANYAVLSSGTGELTGQAYSHNTSIVTRAVTEGAAENVIAVSDVTLVSLVNSSDIAARLADYYAHRITLTVDVNPTLERAGHVVQIFHPWDRRLVNACISSRETKISGLLKSRTTALVGFTPPQPNASQYYDQRIVLTGSGTWTVPENCVSLRAVLIGGGQGGASGSSGKESTECMSVNQTSSDSAATSTFRGYCPMIGGDGGEAGSGGVGGKVLSVSMEVTEGEQIAYACGTGGIGGKHSEGERVAGSVGAATVFGGSTSADGSSSDSGYYDQITGETFAAPGADGVAGGKGGGGDGEANSLVYVDGDTVQDPAGVTWSPGENPTADDAATDSASCYGWFDNGVGSYSTQWTCTATAYQNKGAGGGAAVGGNGRTGTMSATAPNVWAYSASADNIHHGKAYAIAYGGVGGDGADAAAPSKASVYGCGGMGGHGGGGAGGGGYAYGKARVSKTYAPEAYNAGGNIGKSGTPGAGSDGGTGADGCIILYLRIRGGGSAGAVATSDGTWLLDRLGRRFIV